MAKKSKKKKTTTTESATKPGRPKGSASSDCQPVKVVKPCCRKCGSSDLKRERIIRELVHHADHDGLATTKRRWTRAQCAACGQWQTIIEDYNE